MSNPITGVVVHADGSVEDVLVSDFKAIQDIVGGYFEVLRSNSEDTTLWLNEEGRILGLEPNLHASAILWFINPAFRGHILVGPVLITGGSDEKGGTLGITDEGKNAVAAFCG